MLGTFVNVGAIIVGTIIGCFLKKGIKEQYQDALFNAMGFAAMALGIRTIASNMNNSKYPVLFIVSLALGSLIGSIFNIDEKIQRLIGKKSKSNLGQGLTTGVLLYCVGTLSILGPVMSAIHGDNSFLFTNATLDFVTSMVFGSTYGIGMILAAPILLAWQGSIYLVAYFLSGAFFSKDLITEVSIVGGILILSSGINILKIKEVKVLNMLPALAFPILFFVFKGII
jgi:uncharacterized membrane protein YqgA involved in biofilm formation